MSKFNLKRVLKYLKKITKISLISAIGLFFLIVIALFLPITQNYIKNKGVEYLRNTFQSEVSIKSLSYGIFNTLTLEELYIADRQKDTLLFAQKANIDISLSALIFSEVAINQINLKGVKANISRNLPDSSFNFDFILESFSDSTAIPDTTTSSEGGWNVTANSTPINLEDVVLRYDDETLGIKSALRLDTLNLSLKKMDLQKKKYHLSKLKLAGVNGKYIQKSHPSAQESSSDTASTVYDIELPITDLRDIHLLYEDEISAQKATLNLHTLNLKPTKLDLSKQIIALENFKTQKLELAYTQDEISIKDSIKVFIEEVENSNEEELSLDFIDIGWKIDLKSFEISESRVSLDNTQYSIQKSGIDYNHLDLKNLHCILDDFSWNDKRISLNLQKLAFQERSGFALKEFKSRIYLGKNKATFEQLQIKTQDSQIGQNIILKYPSLQKVLGNLGEINLSLDLKNTYLAYQDALYLMPSLNEMGFFNLNAKEVLNIEALAKGKLSDLSIENLIITTLDQTRLETSGTVKGLPDINLMSINLDFEGNTSQKDLRGLVPATLTLPQKMNLKGKFEGYLDNFQTNARLQTSLGNAQAKAQLRNQSYSLDAQMQDVRLASIISNPDIGSVSAHLQVKGKGLDIERNLNAQVDFVMDKAIYRKTQYDQLEIKGNIRQKSFEGMMSIADTNIALRANTSVDFNASQPTYDLDLLIGKLDLYTLNLYADTLSVKGMVSLKGEGIDPDNLKATLKIDSMQIIKDTKGIPLKYLYAYLNTQQDSVSANIDSDYLNAYLKGKFSLNEIASILTNHLNHYFAFTTAEKPAISELRPASFEFGLGINEKSSLLSDILPELEKFNLDTLQGVYNSQKGKIFMEAHIPEIVYQGRSIKELNVKIDSDSSQLTYTMDLAQVIISDSLGLDELSISGNIQQNSLSVRLLEAPTDSTTRFDIAFNLAKVPKGEDDYRIHLRPEQILNYMKWNIPEDNAVEFGSNQLSAKNFRLSYDEQVISINSEGIEEIKVGLEKINLSLLSKNILEQDTLIAGMLQGEVTIQNALTNLGISADISIADLAFQKVRLGNLSLQADNTQKSTLYEIKIALKGDENQMNLEGSYDLNPVSTPIDLDIKVDKLSLKTLKAFSFGEISETKGFLKGNLAMKGSIEQFTLNGDLNFQEAALKLTRTNSLYRFENEKVTFNQQGISFQNFQIKDSLDNQLQLDGKVLTQNYQEFQFNLDVNADDFVLLNSTKENDETYYGILALDAKAHIGGDLNQPVVNASLNIKDATNLTYVYIPEELQDITKSEGIVRFVDKSNPNADSLYLKADSLANTGFKGIDLTAEITIDKIAEFTIILNQYTSDVINIKGGGNLSFTMSPNGQMLMTGIYEISDGKYNISLFDVIQKEFDIVEGSSISWSGDLISPTLDLTARYKVETSPYNLVSKQITESGQNAYKLKQTFYTNLKLKDQALNPTINFDIAYPEGFRNTGDDLVQQQINQINQNESEVNKQVFSLLVLGSFLSQNSIFQSSGGGLDVRGSVSDLLSSQLNKLSEQYITGVDLNFNLDSYEDLDQQGQIEQNTDLNINLKKNLFNDRLSVSLGGTVGLEGSTQSNGGQKIATDIIVEYKITADGRYRLKVYNVQEPTQTFDQVSKSGVSILFTRDYNRFKNLFKNKKINNNRKKKTNTEESEDKP